MKHVFKPGYSGLTSRQKNLGLSLIEFMIAITLGLIVLGGVTTVFVNASQSRAELEKTNRLVGEGRAAIELMNEDLRMAGYMGEFDTTPMLTPSALPDICATAQTDLINAMMLHVQGVNNAAAAALSCLGADLKTGTDIIAVRRASSCDYASDTNCRHAPYLQASLCSKPDNKELAYLPANNTDYANHYFALSTAYGDMTRHKEDCTTLSSVEQYQVHIYFVAKNHEAGDGIPTLWRAELDENEFELVPLVEGVDDLQVVYGMDRHEPPATTGVASDFNSAPDGPKAWRQVVEANVYLLMRNTDKSVGYTDTHVYAMGDVTAGPFNDPYKRHVYASQIRFANVSWRRAP